MFKYVWSGRIKLWKTHETHIDASYFWNIKVNVNKQNIYLYIGMTEQTTKNSTIAILNRKGSVKNDKCYRHFIFPNKFIW